MKKKLLILAVLIIAGIGMINAQEPKKNEGPRKPPTVEERLKHVKETLAKDASLSAEKQQKIMELFKQFFVKADKIAPPPPPPSKEEMDKLVKERDEAVAKVLTAEEFKRYKEAEKKLRPPHPPKPGEGGENPPPPPQN